ncbi:MAG: ABC transporter ATP-binding protein/permease, partial [Firmicutes bacterium]|nr:ABC transporter ATP-binding protein/permease [Bacillota bacterium]
ELQRAEAAWVRVGKLLATRSRVGDPGEEKVRRLPAGPLSVIFDRVTFAYDENGEPALDEVEFRVEPGRVLGLLGRTGSGKTTVARLLFRLYDPTRGRVELGGRDIRDVRLDDLRCRVGLVTQDVQLFHASVRDNLTFFRPEAPDDFLLAVLDEVGLGEWLRALPTGLDTVLSPGGSSLSAGEAQLLAFARLLLRDPGLVVLDEASSRLDPLTERRLERAMRRALDGRTGVVIAHRLETLSLADDILILEDGRVVEHGERVSLARDPDSHFARLLRTGLEEVLA